MFAADTCPSLLYLGPAMSSCQHPGSSWLLPAAMDRSGEEPSWGLAGRGELGLVTGAEQAPQGRLRLWTWPALSQDQGSIWWDVGAEAPGALFSHG